ncbi:MAG: hypothetical protein M3R70_05480 [Actinomycetota bacterium]|nr:hypothetical protein [Actinomycetota bacterium]
MNTPPELKDLVGDDLSPGERARLERVHNLLVAAGPPADVPPAIAEPAEQPHGIVRVLPRRRRSAALLVAAAIAAAAFGAGYFAGASGGEKKSSFVSTRTVRLHSTPLAPQGVAVVRVGRRDHDGNFPMLVTVRGLKKLGQRGYYTLALTKDGRPVVVCGTFRVRAGGRLTVPMTVAYDVTAFDGWVVTEYRHGRDADPVVLTT